MSSKYITDFLDAVAADLAGQLPQERIDGIRATMEPFVPIVLAHALRLSDVRLTALAAGSGGWVDYCYTDTAGMTVKITYPGAAHSADLPPAYTVPYGVFFSDTDIGAWRASKDAEHKRRLEDEAAAIQAAKEAEAARAKRDADIAERDRLIALYGMPQDGPPPAAE